MHFHINFTNEIPEVPTIKVINVLIYSIHSTLFLFIQKELLYANNSRFPGQIAHSSIVTSTVLHTIRQHIRSPSNELISELLLYAHLTGSYGHVLPEEPNPNMHQTT